jgi:hypothetical protein
VKDLRKVPTDVFETKIPMSPFVQVPTDVFETKIPMSPFVQVSDAGMPRSCPASDSRRLACLLSGEDRK